METKLNVFTCCNGVYKEFIPLFILSNLYHNEEVSVEIGVDETTSNLSKSLDILNLKYKNKFLVRKVTFNRHFVNGELFNFFPNTVRFFTPPVFKSKYVYISDVDIINLQSDICSIHVKNMEKTKLPYSNIVRPTKNRLSGLHFTPYENYYPIPEFNDLIKKGVIGDENFLYELVKKRYPNFNYEETYRPVHGIHVSLNRTPVGKLGWGMSGWKNQWVKFRNSDIFLEIEPTLTEMIKDKIKIIDDFYQ